VYGNSIGMAHSGALTASFLVPYSGRWRVWLEGQYMPGTLVRVDGRKLVAFSGRVDGDVIVNDTVGPVGLPLPAGLHTVTVELLRSILAPGDGGTAELSSIFLTPAADGSAPVLREMPAAAWRSLCGTPLQWAELLRG
jgi:hypothetical protein